MVSIAAFQAVDPGSIHGRRKFLFTVLLEYLDNFTSTVIFVKISFIYEGHSFSYRAARI